MLWELSERFNFIQRKTILNSKLNLLLLFPFSIFLQAMLVCKSVYLLLTILVFKSSCVNGSNQLHIGGIFPIGGKGGWQGGQGNIGNPKWDLWFQISETNTLENRISIELFEICYLFVYLVLCITHTVQTSSKYIVQVAMLRESSSYIQIKFLKLEKYLFCRAYLNESRFPMRGDKA